MFKRNVFCSLYARAGSPCCGVYIFKHTVWYFMTKFTNTFWWRQQTVVALFAYCFRQESLLQVGVSTVKKIKIIVYNQNMWSVVTDQSLQDVTLNKLSSLADSPCASLLADQCFFRNTRSCFTNNRAKSFVLRDKLNFVVLTELLAVLRETQERWGGEESYMYY